MSNSKLQSLTATVFALLLLINTAGAGVGLPVDGQTRDSLPAQDTAVQTDDEKTQADDAYVTENGTVVLVYNESSESSATSHAGADLSAGLFHLFLEDKLNGTTAANSTGQLSVLLSRDKLTGEGSLKMPAPEKLEDLSLKANAVTNEQTSKGSFTMDAAFSGNMSSKLKSMTTDGFAKTTGTQFSSEGSGKLVFSEPPESMKTQSASVTIAEQKSSYTLDVEREYKVSKMSKKQWSTKKAAKQTLNMQFSLIGASLGGDVSVTINDHSFDSETRRLDISYTVTFSGVDKAVSNRLATMLANSQDLNLTQAEAKELSKQIQEMKVTKLSGSVETTDRKVNTEWDVQLDNYDKALLAALEIANAYEPMDGSVSSQMSDSLEKARAQIEARRAANLVQKTEWKANIDGQKQTVSAEMSVSTKNWNAYVSELKKRDMLSFSGETKFDMTAETKDGTVTVEGSMSVSQDEMISKIVENYRKQLQSTPAMATEQSSDVQQKALSAVESFENAGFDRAKMDVDVGNGTVKVEGAANFTNATALANVYESEYGGTGTLASLFVESSDEQQKTYVRVENAVEKNPSESAVRELKLVGKDTTVHLPDDWDENEMTFPQIDKKEVRSYLEGSVDAGVDDDGNSSSMGMMPIAAGGAVLAVVGGAAIVLGRRE